jgi:RNA polymerase sigma-70 factor (ECF subfamily)
MVRAASSRPLGESQAGDVRDALESLCEGYWFPLYGYVRRKGHTADEARDLTQAFFARLLDKRDFDAASPEHGRFRAFLLASLRNFLSNERDRQRALKRGGGEVPLSIDARDADSRYSIDIGHELTPERAFERAWALALLDRALSSVRETYAERDQVALFEALEGTLGGHEGEEDRASLAERLGMTEGALNVAAHRLRRTFRERLRAEIAGTVSDPGDVEDELAALFDALGR